MKKTVVLLLCLILVFSMTGCSTLIRIAAGRTSSASAPEATSVPNISTEETSKENESPIDAEPTTAPAGEPAEESTSDPTVESTPKPTAEPPIEEIQAALELYHTLFETGITQVSDGIWQLNACDVLAADPATFSPHGYNPLYWMEGFALYDINHDYIPELILESGEVEKSIYVFTARNGKIEFLAESLSGNQDEINYALHAYLSAENEIKCFSIGTAGSGAGELHFAYEITSDFIVNDTFYCYDGMDGSYIRINGEETDAAAYETEYEAYFSSMTLLEKVPFIPYGSDPLAALEEAMHG